MRKRVQAWIMAFVLLFTTVALPLMDAVSVQAADEQLKVQIHYYRADGNYDDWDIFAWGGLSGCTFQKNGNAYVTDEHGAVAETVVTPGSSEVGFIVRYGGDNWTDREWSDEGKTTGDRKFDVSGYTSGTIHVYVKSGETETVVDFTNAVKNEVEVETLKKELNIQFHYNREDKDYAAWELYTWDSFGNPGYEVQFDADGIANVVVPEDGEKQGFIVKKDGTWEKDWNGDRFVNTNDYVAGTIHVYVTGGAEGFDVDYSEAVENKLYINFHYNRNDGNYAAYELYTWDSYGNDGYAVQFGENGIAKVEVPAGGTKQGFIVKEDGTWNKDWDGDRFVKTEGFIAGTIDVYVTEATEAVTVEYKNAVEGTYVAPEEPEEDNLTIQFHYLREDGNYDGWNVAAWDGASGATFEKDDNGYITDANGAVAISEVTPGSTKIGFIVRYSIEGNDWAAKDWDGDRFVEIKDYVSGTIHVYVTSGQEAIVVDYSEAKKEPLKINFFIDKKKTDDNWGLWLWDDIGTEAIYPLFVENADGKLQITYEVATGATWVGFIVRDDNWQKDPDGDRTVDVSTIVGGEINVYLTSGTSDFVTDDENAVKGAKVKKAIYVGSNIVVTTSLPLSSLEDVFTVWSGDESVEIKSVVAGEGENEYIISFNNELDRSKAYAVKMDGNSYKVTMPSLYKDEVWVEENTYTGDDLGATWTKEKTTFKVWAPLASEVSVNLYKEGKGGDKLGTFAMEKTENGVWAAAISGDLNGVYYTYTVNNSGEVKEACDPYAVTTGVNGDRAMVLDLDSTDPEGWENDKNPNADLNFNDIVLYELHVRDASIDESSGVSDENKGNFLGLTEHGENTVLDHMVDLGITHVHLLPVYDFSSVDEEKDGFNWGYDPKNYNVPEGSYSSDPYNGEVRVKEMKEMVQTLHENGISVVMDVVYNHVSDAQNFCFNQIVPNYFSRMNENGGYSSNSGCGNDTASEHAMVRKYIVESVKYWADEYHIDGFRFDLVGLIDTVTINEIMKEVWSDHPDVVFYGEGWSMNSYDTGVSMTTQTNSTEVPEFAFFNDNLRNLLKGSVFDLAPGYVSGGANSAMVDELIDCFMGLPGTWCTTPNQTINYNSCHDNYTLIDRITLSQDESTSREDIVKMNNLATAILFTSQGIPFIHAGEEFLRSKPDSNSETGYNENSYSAGDAINSIKWDTLATEESQDVYAYYKGLIEFRKAHAALRLTNAEDVNNSITTLTGLDQNVAGFVIKGGVNGEEDDAIVVIFNPNKEATTVTLPEGEWNIYVNGEDAGTKVLGTASGSVKVDAISAMVLVDEADVTEDPEKPGETTPVVPEKGEEITKEDVEIAENNKTSEVVKEDNKEYVVLGNEAMEDIAIKGEKDVLSEDAFFVRKYLEKGEKFEIAKNAIEAKLKEVAEYKAIEIDLYSGDGKEITKLDGYVYITIPVPADMEVAKGNVLAVYRVNDDGSLVNCDAKVVDGEITFRTNHFSTFVIVEQAATAVLPVTGDNSMVGLYVLIMLAGVAVSMAGVANTKKRMGL